MPVIAHTQSDPMVLGRINVPDRCKLPTFAGIVRGDPLVLLRYRMAKQAKNALKRLIGYENYRRMYRVRYRIGA